MNSSPQRISSPGVAWAVALAAGLLLAGCGGKTGSAASSRGGDSASGQLSPAAAVTTTQTISVLPPAQDSTVTWTDFKAIIRANPDSVRAVMQTHRREVIATFRNGVRLHATEPAIDDIIPFLRQIDPAGQILIATE